MVTVTLFNSAAIDNTYVNRLGWGPSETLFTIGGKLDLASRSGHSFLILHLRVPSILKL
jgi:hypothetical protein